MIDEILTKLGLKYEDLSKVERETLHTWMESLDKNTVTLASVKTYISSMKDSVEQELTKIDNGSKQDIFLKARLRNYMLLEAFLFGPEKAKQAIDRAIASLVKKVI